MQDKFAWIWIRVLIGLEITIDLTANIIRKRFSKLNIIKCSYIEYLPKEKKISNKKGLQLFIYDYVNVNNFM